MATKPVPEGHQIVTPYLTRRLPSAAGLMAELTG